MNGGNRQELLWRLFRSFFRSRDAFLVLFDRYEARVLEFSEKFQIDREKLRVSADDLLTLLDFKSLEELRDREILTLKQMAHLLFRRPDATDLFDHYVSNIYHELSILKEEHYTLREDFLRLDEEEYDRFFREVAEFYPKRLRHVRNLYGKALRRLEALLPQFRDEKVFVRSLYLFGEELLSSSYPGGLKALYRRMYPAGGAAQGYAEAASSFLESGFEQEALAAYRKARDSLSDRRRRRGDEAARKAIARDVEGQIRRLEKSRNV